MVENGDARWHLSPSLGENHGDNTMKPAANGNETSGSSPGQAEKRDQLIQIYDELDDAGKQELLRLAQELGKPR
jgi:hypothetical protein